MEYLNDLKKKIQKSYYLTEGCSKEEIAQIQDLINYDLPLS